LTNDVHPDLSRCTNDIVNIITYQNELVKLVIGATEKGSPIGHPSLNDGRSGPRPPSGEAVFTAPLIVN
jgi:hypothetical protein